MTTQPTLTVAEDAIEGADAYLSNAILPTYSELLAALRALDDQAGHTMRKPAGHKAYSAVVVPRATMESARALLARHDQTMAGNFRYRG